MEINCSSFWRSMNCQEYIERFLSAHADNELRGRERRAANDHVGGCGACRARLADERKLKELIRTRIRVARAPSDVRLRIQAALEETPEGGVAERKRLHQDADRLLRAAANQCNQRDR